MTNENKIFSLQNIKLAKTTMLGDHFDRSQARLLYDMRRVKNRTFSLFILAMV